MKYLLQQLILLVFVICTFVNRVKAEVNYAYCSEKYGNLTYIPEAQMFEKYPPHLISFPGSGNSFVRLLIEYSTGFHTGSMGTDDFEYFKCKVIQQSSKQIVKRRKAVKVDLLSDKDIDGNAITPLEKKNLILIAKPLYQSSKLEQKED